MGFIKRRDAWFLLKKWNIPKKYRWIILREMSLLEFLQETDGGFRVNECAAERGGKVFELQSEVGLGVGYNK